MELRFFLFHSSSLFFISVDDFFLFFSSNRIGDVDVRLFSYFRFIDTTYMRSEGGVLDLPIDIGSISFQFLRVETVAERIRIGFR